MSIVSYSEFINFSLMEEFTIGCAHKYIEFKTKLLHFTLHVLQLA